MNDGIKMFWLNRFGRVSTKRHSIANQPDYFVHFPRLLLGVAASWLETATRWFPVRPPISCPSQTGPRTAGVFLIQMLECGGAHWLLFDGKDAVDGIDEGRVGDLDQSVPEEAEEVYAPGK
jgi:hypothetical protein